MTTSTLNIKPYTGGIFGLLPRIVFLISGILVGALLMHQAFLGTSDVLIRIACCAFALVVSAVVVALSFAHTEFDNGHIATVIRIGRLIRFERDAVRWDEVREAKVVRGTRPPTAELRLVTTDGRKFSFSISQNCSAAESFDAIAEHFHKGAAGS